MVKKGSAVKDIAEKIDVDAGMDSAEVSENASKKNSRKSVAKKAQASHSKVQKGRDSIKISAVSVLLVITILLMGYNTYLINSLSSMSDSTVSKGSEKQASSQQVALTGDPVQDAINAAIPTGVPDIYGSEISVSFDDPVNSMNILESYDRKENTIKISDLTSEQKDRYVYVGMRTSCEFCCGAKSLIFQDGRAACGCAHSAAMRGLALYLVVNHPDEYTNDQIIEEVNKWKALFFPKQTVEKVLKNMEATGEIDTSVVTKGTEALPGMVGGC